MKYCLILFLLIFHFSTFLNGQNNIAIKRINFYECLENLPELEKRFLIKIDDKMGFVNGCGKIVINPYYDSALEFSESLARVEKDGKYGFINKDGDLVVDFSFDFAWFFREGLAVVKTEENKKTKIFYIDKFGKHHFENKFDQIFSFKNGLAFVKKGEKQFLINKNGEIVKKDGIIAFSERIESLKLSQQIVRKEVYGFVLGKGLTKLPKIERFFYQDYSGQKQQAKNVFAIEPVSSCENVTLFQKENGVLFKIQNKIIKKIYNSRIYEAPVCRKGVKNIVWIEKNIEESFIDKVQKWVGNILNLNDSKIESRKRLEMYTLDGKKIVSFGNKESIRNIYYLARDVIAINEFSETQVIKIYSLSGRHIIESNFLLLKKKLKLLNIKQYNPKSFLSDMTDIVYCKNNVIAIKERFINDEFYSEIYNLNNNKILFREKNMFFSKYLVDGSCLIVGHNNLNTYYLNDRFEVFWEDSRPKSERGQLFP